MTEINYENVSKHYLYGTWSSIKERCIRNPGKCYNNINMHYLWIDDSYAFLKWIDNNLGLRPSGYSLDRIDGNGHYEPGNLRWASKKDQAKNKRFPDITSQKHSEHSRRLVSLGKHNFQKKGYTVMYDTETGKNVRIHKSLIDKSKHIGVRSNKLSKEKDTINDS